jgi:THO complex subunit 2
MRQSIDHWSYFLLQSKYDELRRAGKSHKKLATLQLQQKYAEASNTILDPITDMMKNYLPSKTWEDISPQFYVTFWSLTLYDLFVPTEAYGREINRVKQLSIAAGENKDFTSSKRKKEQERCQQLIEKLQDEQRRQREHVSRVMAKLNMVRHCSS